MSAYHRQRLKEEKKASLEQRRSRLRAMLQEEQDRLEAELRELVPDRSTLASQLVHKTEELRTAREERRKKVGYFIHFIFYKTMLYPQFIPCIVSLFFFLPLACTRAAEGTLEEKQPRVARGSYV